MELNKISDKLSVTGQVFPDQVAALADAGFRAVICNRPDGEEAEQPEFAAIAAVAAENDLTAHYIPVQPGVMEQADVDAFAAALADAEGPVVAYCRTGNRSAGLWAAYQAQQGTPKAVA